MNDRAHQSAWRGAWYCAIAVFVVVSFRPLDDVDLFTQIMLGKHLLAGGALQTSDPLVFSLPDAVHPNPGWLAQILFASLENAFGIKALQLLNGVCFGVAFWCFLSRKSSFGAAALASLLALCACGSSTPVRPQMFAVLGMGVLVLLLRSPPRPIPDTLGAFFLGVLWQNCHPSVALGVMVTILHGLTERSLRSCAPIAAALCLALFCTPEGVAIFEVSARNALISTFLGISEWMPAAHRSVRDAMFGFWTTVVVTLALLVRAPRAVPWRMYITPLAFLILTLCSARFVLFWALLMIPCWELLALQITGRFPVPSRMPSPVLVALVAAFATLRSLQADPFGKSLPMTSLQNVVLQLKGENISKVYNYREWAGPLHFLGNGELQTAIDGRLYLYDQERWMQYTAEARGERSAGELMKIHHVSAFILRPSFHQELIRRLLQDPRCTARVADELVEYIQCQSSV